MATLAVAGCTVDTELGLDATIDAATVVVGVSDVSASLEVTYRVGEHAEGERTFQPQSIDLFNGDVWVISLTPAAASDFEATLAPGQQRTTTFEGATSDGFDPASLCDGGEVRVVLRWADATTSETATAEAIADVICR